MYKCIFLICDVFIPIMMITIGLLYIVNSSKIINTFLNFILSIAMFILVASDNHKENEEDDVRTLANKKCGAIWICGGLFMLIVTIVALVLNKNENTSIALLEIECVLIVIIFISIEYFFKRKTNKN